MTQIDSHTEYVMDDSDHTKELHLFSRNCSLAHSRFHLLKVAAHRDLRGLGLSIGLSVAQLYLS